jgi:hypothetical protein
MAYFPQLVADTVSCAGLNTDLLTVESSMTVPVMTVTTSATIPLLGLGEVEFSDTDQDDAIPLGNYETKDGTNMTWKAENGDQAVLTSAIIPKCTRIGKIVVIYFPKATSSGDVSNAGGKIVPSTPFPIPARYCPTELTFCAINVLNNRPTNFAGVESSIRVGTDGSLLVTNNNDGQGDYNSGISCEINPFSITYTV